MAEAKTTQTQANQFTEQFKKSMDEQMARMEAVQQEMASLEKKNMEQMQRNMQEMARLFQEGLQYSAQLSAEWRKMSLEAARRTATMMSTNPWT
jgi:DNA-binding transcriptional regulator GbsR (MarR family)